jgi:LPS export ABC transporter protein LptC
MKGISQSFDKTGNMKGIVCRFGSFPLFWMAGVLTILFMACENDLAEVRSVISQEAVGVETMRDVEILYSDSAVLRVRIRAPLLLRHFDSRTPYEEFPEGVDVDFYDPLGRKQSRLTSNYAIRHESKGQIIARDSVVWKSYKQERLETEELIWEEENARIYSNKFVTITKPEEVSYGVGFETNQEFTRWKINAPEGEILVDEEGKKKTGKN